MGSGYVLAFTNRSFQEFIADSVGRDIYDSKYAYAGGSKANRLRALWKIEPNSVVGKLLKDLFTYVHHVSNENPDDTLVNECQRIAARLLTDLAVGIFLKYVTRAHAGA